VEPDLIPLEDANWFKFQPICNFWKGNCAWVWIFSTRVETYEWPSIVLFIVYGFVPQLYFSTALFSSTTCRVRFHQLDRTRTRVRKLILAFREQSIFIGVEKVRNSENFPIPWCNGGPFIKFFYENFQFNDKTYSCNS